MNVCVQNTQTQVIVDKEQAIIQILTGGGQGPPGPPGAAGGTMDLVAGIDLSGHRVVATDANGQLAYSSGLYGVGITQGASMAGDVATIRYGGMMDEPTWTWIPDQPIFQTGAGYLTQTPPSSGFVRQVGVALSATSMKVEFSPAIVLTP